MKKYIVDLTTDIIRRAGYYETVKYMLRNNSPEFVIEFLKFEIETGPLAPPKMSPETIGRILGSLEKWDVLASSEAFFKNVRFAGDPADTFCALAANCLAHIIFYRINPDQDTIRHIPEYVPAPSRKRR